MVEIPVLWKVSVEGGEQLKNKFMELNYAFENNEKSAKEFAQGMRELGREATALNNVGQVQNRIWLAANPGLNALNRSFSNFSHVANTTLSIMNAINLATIASTGTSAALADQKLSEQEAWRLYQIALQQFGKDSIQAKDAEEKWRIEHEKTGNLIKQQDQQNAERLVNFGAALILITGEMVSMIAKGPEFIKNMKDIGIAIKGLGASATFASITSGILSWLAPLAVFAAALYGVQYIFDTIFPESAKLAKDKIKRYWGIEGDWAFLAAPFWNLYEVLAYHILPDMQRDFATTINGHIDLINILIDAINTIPKALGFKGLDKIGHMAVPPGGGDIDYIEWTKNNPAAMGKTGTSSELLNQSKTANQINKDIADQAKSIEDHWKSLATPTIQDINATGKIQTEVARSQLNSVIQSVNIQQGMLMATGDVIKQLQTVNRNIGRISWGAAATPSSSFAGGSEAAAWAAANRGGYYGPKAQGFDGVVAGPAFMKVGEAGPERVTIGQPGGGATVINITNNIAGSVWKERELTSLMDSYLKGALKRVGFK